jgi:hypothetical protein
LTSHIEVGARTTRSLVLGNLGNEWDNHEHDDRVDNLEDVCLDDARGCIVIEDGGHDIGTEDDSHVRKGDTYSGQAASSRASCKEAF